MAEKIQRNRERFRSALCRVSALVLMVAASWNVPATLRQVMGLKPCRLIANVDSVPRVFPGLGTRLSVVIWLNAREFIALSDSIRQLNVNQTAQIAFSPGNGHESDPLSFATQRVRANEREKAKTIHTAGSLYNFVGANRRQINRRFR